jgi:predicted  nucleic acid-binding Zn-ribbon protein
MAEDDSLEAPSTVLQSTATKRDARKVPGGFGIDDEDDLSPTKPDFPDLLWRNNNSNNLKHSRIPSLNAALPPLPPDGSSILSNTTNDTAGKNDSHMDTLDEREMRRHLMDIESSILPAPSPIAAGPHPGADDTYLFDGPPKPPQVPPHRSKPPQPDHHTTDDGSDALEQTGLSDEDSSYPSPKADDYKTPRPWNLEGRGRTEDRTEELVLNESGDTTASLETMSSPTAAARERTLSRARSTTSGGYETANERNYTSHEDTDEDHEEEGNNERTPRRPRVIATHTRESSDERSTLRHQDSTHDLAYSVDAGRTPGAALTNGRSSIRRPKYLRNRHTSQRSSVSSFVTNPESSGDHDTTGADYALQSGGAVPIGGVSRNSSYMLSRAISLGSIASGLDGSVSDTGLPAGEGPLATLDEEGQNRQQNVSESKGTDTPTPETPRGMNTRSLAPTDTVIAQHVRNLEVPETAAREYRSKHGVSPGRYSGLPTPSAGRTAKSLTLKEQSSTIDRLSKENWDLKLRIYFLSERLDKLSDEGVKDSISEIVELKTALATMQKDNKALKRKIRDLERKNQGDEERPSTARSRNSSDDPMFEHEAHEREEELIWLRERVDEYIIEIEKLKSENLNREADKRKLAEVVKSMGERRGPEDVEAREEMDVWKDLLEQETARREQADEDNRRLREEIFRLKATSNSPAVPSHNTTSNTYNIHRTQHHLSPTRPRSVQSDLPFRHHDHDGHSLAASSTLVEELRRESEQLRHENDELRREVGAQTSMLTSRNREKERLYQEIEDLKLGVRRAGGSIAGDSILERSASRAHVRSTSRASLAGFGTRRDMSAAPTSETHIDAEREDLENKNAELRDGINSLKLQNQELQRELETCQRDFEVAIAAKHESEAHIKELQEELEVAEQDLQVMQAERDETLLQFQDLETEFETLRGEAQAELDTLEADVRDKDAFIGRLDAELRDRNENFEALQREMRSLSEGIVRLEDDSEAKMRRNQELEQALQEASRDVEEMEKQLQEANAKLERLTVQHESSQNEISFLREEQDGDKIKISDLSAALSAAESSLRDEMERVKELEQRLAGERRQREMVASREKQEVQRMVNELNRECSSAKDEVRGLRKKLGSREVEAAEWKERLLELEGNLREALGDLNGTRSSLLKVCCVALFFLFFPFLPFAQFPWKLSRHRTMKMK